MTARLEYEKEWTTERRLPACSRLRVGHTNARGTPILFVVQLEYRHAGAWLQVARFDHDADGDVDHDVERTGLHLDVYHPEAGKITTLQRWPPRPADEAMGIAADYLKNNAEQYVRRFERWL